MRCSLNDGEQWTAPITDKEVILMIVVLPRVFAQRLGAMNGAYPAVSGVAI